MLTVIQYSFGVALQINMDHETILNSDEEGASSGAQAWHPAMRPETSPPLEAQPITHDEATEHSSSAPIESPTDLSDSNKASVPSLQPKPGLELPEGSPISQKTVNAAPHGITSGEDENTRSGELGVAQDRISSEEQGTAPEPESADVGEVPSEQYHEDVVGAKVVKDTSLAFEESDPTGGFARSSTRHFLQDGDRSNSFPSMPTLSTGQIPGHVEHLPMSQTEAQFQEIEEEREVQHEDLPATEDTSHTVVGGHTWPSDDTTGDDDGEASVGFFDNFHGSVNAPAEPSDPEARYEEGMPLMRPASLGEQALDNVPVQEDPADDFFGDVGTAGEDSFFDQPSQQTYQSVAHQAPPQLDRKSTSDVLNSLHFAPQQSLPTLAEDSDNPPEQPSVRSIDSVSKDVSASHDLGVLQADVQTEPREDELAAQWKAALDDDEFLVEDDDDLLPDSEPGSPSSFLDQLKEDTAHDTQMAGQSAERQYRHDRGSSAGNVPSGRPPIYSNPYTPHQPSTSDLTQGLSDMPYGNVGLSQSGTARPAFPPQSFSYFQAPTQRPAPAGRAESYADQSKGGYKSPYDLPTDLSRPRKRVQMHQPAPPVANSRPPPPRTSSMSSDIPTGASRSTPITSPTGASFPNFGSNVPLQSGPPPPRGTGAAPTPQQSVKPKPSTGSFFEDLPMAPKTRPSTAQGRFTPQQSAPGSGPPPVQRSIAPPPPSQITTPAPAPAQPRPADPYAQYQLQPPERLDPFASVPLQTPLNAPNVSTRYSPAPPGLQAGKPTPSPRYSPAPPVQANNQSRTRYASQAAAAVPPTTSLPFQPRTSSPLAQGDRNASRPHQLPGTVSERRESLPIVSQQAPFPSRRPSGPISAASYNNTPQAPFTSDPVSQPRTSQTGYSAPYPATVPMHPTDSHAVSDPPFPPPRRSQTHSPSKKETGPALSMAMNESVPRPASVHGQSSPTKAARPPRPSVRQRGMSQSLSFITPTDGQQFDDLQRWRGSPIFRFGFGGSIVSSFPKHIPRYIAGQPAPMIKPSNGEVKVRNVKELYPLDEHAMRFPGPLKSKSKKKDVLAWLSERIAILEKEAYVQTSSHLPDLEKRHQEKILLWRVVRTLVEYDGVLEGKSDVQTAIRSIISPDLALQENPQNAYTLGADMAGIYRPSGSVAQPDAVDPTAVERLRKHLLYGEREKAVWEAVDHRLWAHAMLIASTLDKSIWKQVVQEFVRRDVKSIGENTESLAALYEIFAGNLEESIDELVPPSARAGLQMVSKLDSAGPTKNALDGLDRWRETLGLVLSNRSADDHQALAALGRLLGSYGRVEASHICHLFARLPNVPTVFGGADDPQVSIVLLGADHRQQLYDFSRDDDAILLTEVYEFAMSTLASNTSSLMPYLQAYKLQHANLLAENGYKTEAQQYCDAIIGSLKSTTKPSPYYHRKLFDDLENLSRRIQSAPTDGSSKWISKPSIEKVSGSMWNKFSSFVQGGDDSDAASTGSGKDPNHEFGPFAKATGTPPAVSRSTSNADLYGAYGALSNPVPIPNTTAGSRYAPGSQYASRSSSEMQRPRASLDSQRSPSYAPSNQMQQSYEPSPPAHNSFSPPLNSSMYQTNPQSRYSPSANAYQSTPPQTSYAPIPESQESSFAHLNDPYVPTSPPEEYVPTPPQEHEPTPSYGGYQPQSPPLEQHGFEDTAPSGGYEAPSTTSNGYEPTSYTPYEPDASAPSSPEQPRRVRLPGDDDDDDDFTSRSSAMQKAERARKDREAEDAFKKAAEADASRPNTLKNKPSSWFGGWFAKDKGDLGSQAGGGGGGSSSGPIRAKLGEQSSFYYDPDLKKWVNKKDPGSATPSARATPPPPRGTGPMNRTVSATGMPPPPAAATSISGPPGAGPPKMPSSVSMPSMSAAAAAASSPPLRGGSPADTSGPPSGAVTPGLGESRPGSSGAPGPPPSRPATTLSNMSSIDDLLGAPGTASSRKAGGTLKGKKKGRYVDVMAQGK